MAAVLITFLGLINQAYSDSYYVDSNLGNDSWLGTATNPWQTLDKLINTSIVGPSTVFLRGIFNTTYEIQLGTVQGTRDNPVRYTSWDDNAPPTLTGPGNSQAAIEITNISATSTVIGLEFDNLIFTAQVFFMVAQPGVWDYIRFSRIYTTNLILGSYDVAQISNFIVQDSTFTGGYLYLYNVQDALIENCSFSLLIGVLLANVQRVTVQDCVSVDGLRGFSIFAPYRDILFQRCTSINNSFSGFLVDDAGNNQVGFNVSILDSISLMDGMGPYAGNAGSNIVFVSTYLGSLMSGLTIRNVTMTRGSPCPLLNTSGAGIGMYNTDPTSQVQDLTLSNVTITCGTDTNGTVVPAGKTMLCDSASTCHQFDGYVSDWIGIFNVNLSRSRNRCTDGDVITQWLSPAQAKCSSGSLFNGQPMVSYPVTSSAQGFRPSDLFIRVAQNDGLFTIDSLTSRVTQFMDGGNFQPSVGEHVLVRAPSSSSTVVGWEVQFTDSSQAYVSALRFFFDDVTLTVGNHNQNIATTAMCPQGQFLTSLAITGYAEPCTYGVVGACSDGTVISGPIDSNRGSILVQNITGWSIPQMPISTNYTCTSVLNNGINGAASPPIPGNSSWATLAGFSTEYYSNTSTSLDIQLIYTGVTRTVPEDPKWSEWYGVSSSTVNTPVQVPATSAVIGLETNGQILAALPGARDLAYFPNITNTYHRSRFVGALRRSDLVISTISSGITSIVPPTGASRALPNAIPVSDIPSDALIRGVQRQYDGSSFLFATAVRFSYNRGWFTPWLTNADSGGISQHSECPPETIVTTLRLRQQCSITSVQAICSDGTILNSLWGSWGPGWVDINSSTGFRPYEIHVRASNVIESINDVGESFASVINDLGPRRNSTRDLLIGFQIKNTAIGDVRFLFSDVSTVSNWFGGSGIQSFERHCNETEQIINLAVFSLTVTPFLIVAIQATCSDGYVIDSGTYPITLPGIWINSSFPSGVNPSSLRVSATSAGVEFLGSVQSLGIINGDSPNNLPDYLSLVGLEVETDGSGNHMAIRFNFTAIPEPPPPPPAYTWGNWTSCGYNGLRAPNICPPGSYIDTFFLTSTNGVSLTSVQANCSDGTPLLDGDPFNPVAFRSYRREGFQARDLVVMGDRVVYSMLGIGGLTGSIDGYLGLGGEGGAAGIPSNWVVVGYNTYVETDVSRLRFAYQELAPTVMSPKQFSYPSILEPQTPALFNLSGPVAGMITWYIGSGMYSGSSVVIPAFTFLPGQYPIRVTSPGRVYSATFTVVDYRFVCGIRQLGTTVNNSYGVLTVEAICEDGAGPQSDLLYIWTPSCAQVSSQLSRVNIYGVNTGFCLVNLAVRSKWSYYTSRAFLNITIPSKVADTFNITGPVVVNPQQSVQLIGRSTRPGLSHFVWSSITSPLSVLLNAPPTILSAICFPNGVTSPTLTVDPNCLTPGATYTFQLAMSDILTAFFNTATYSFTVRLLPTDGNCAVSQPNLNISQLRVECEGWHSFEPYLLYSLATSSASPTLPNQVLIPPQPNNIFFVNLVTNIYQLEARVMTPQFAMATFPFSTLTMAGYSPPSFSLSYPSIIDPQVWGNFQVTGSASAVSSVVWNIAGRSFTGTLAQVPPFTLTPGQYSFWVSNGVQNIANTFTVSDYTLVVGIQQTAAYSGVVEVVGVVGGNNAAAMVSLSWYGPCVPVAAQTPTTTPSLRLTVASAPSSSSPCTITLRATSPFTQQIASAQLNITFPPTRSAVNNVTVSGPIVSNPQDTLRLLGSADSTEALTFRWTVVPPTVNSGDTCLLGGGTLRALVVGPGCLVAGTSYTFQFTATATTSSQSASVQQVVYIQTLPFGGNCSITQPDPSIGRVAVNCTGWQTDAPYLTYSVFTTNPPVTGLTVPAGDTQTVSAFFVNAVPGVQDFQVKIATPQGAAVMTPSLRVTVAGACVSPRGNSTTQNSISDATITLKCNASEANWQSLQDSLASTLGQQYVSDSQLLQVAAALGDLLANAPTSQISSDQFKQQLLNYLTNLSTLSAGPNGPEIAATVSGSLDNALITLPCNLLDPLLAALQIMSGKLNTVALPGEPPSVSSFNFQTISSTAQYSGAGVSSPTTTSSSTSDGDGVGVTVPASAVPTTSGDVAHLSVTQYSNALARCRIPPSTAGALVGGIADITIFGTDGQAQVVKGVTNPIVVTYGVGRPRCQHVGCVWWDPTTQTWSEAGCKGTPLTPTSYSCSCTHLTEFSLIAAGCPSDKERAGYAFFIAVYSILGIYILVKLAYRLHIDRLKPVSASSSNLRLHGRWGSPHTQHVMLSIHCALRAMGSAALGQFLAMDMIAARSVLLLGPYLLIFWVYTILVFNWVGLFHFAMTIKEIQTKLNVLMVVANVGVIATVVALLVKMVTQTDMNSKGYTTSVLAGTIVLASLTFITAMAFSIYAVLLSRRMSGNAATGTGTIATGSGGGSGPHKKLDIASKVLIFGLVVSVLLFIQSILHIISATAPAYSGFNQELGVLAVDSLLVISLVTVYHAFMVKRR